jgi:hypothetical protein
MTAIFMLQSRLLIQITMIIPGLIYADMAGNGEMETRDRRLYTFVNDIVMHAENEIHIQSRPSKRRSLSSE